MDWQTIDSAPKEAFEYFLAFWPVQTKKDQIQVTHWWPDDQCWLTADDSIDWRQPTHWMPLPAPPRIGGSNA